jgi:hypothetical protein
MPSHGRKLQFQVTSLALNAEGLLKLIGGDDDSRDRFLEQIKGITTPAVWRVIEAQFDAASAQVKTALESVQTVHANARELGGGRAHGN